MRRGKYWGFGEDQASVYTIFPEGGVVWSTPYSNMTAVDAYLKLHNETKYIWADFVQWEGGGGLICTDLFPNTSYRTCIKFALEKKRRGGGGGILPTPPPRVSPMPLHVYM